MSSELILASGSLGRKELLMLAGYDFSIRVSNIEEVFGPDELPCDYVMRLALEKGFNVAQKNESSNNTDVVIIAADTIVVTNDGAIVEKPLDFDHGVQMLMKLSGTSHTAMTGYVIIKNGQILAQGVDPVKLFMRKLDINEVKHYLTLYPLAYTYSGGYSGSSSFLERIEGPYSSLIGLPMHLIVPVLNNLGIVPSFKQSLL